MNETLIIAVAGFPIIYDMLVYREIKNKKNEAWDKVSESNINGS